MADDISGAGCTRPVTEQADSGVVWNSIAGGTQAVGGSLFGPSSLGIEGTGGGVYNTAVDDGFEDELEERNGRVRSQSAGTVGMPVRRTTHGVGYEGRTGDQWRACSLRLDDENVNSQRAQPTTMRRRDGSPRNSHSVGHSRVRTPSGVSSSDDRDDKSAFQYARHLTHMNIAEKPKCALREHILVIVSAIVMALADSLEGGKRWMEEGKIRCFPQWPDVVSYSGIENMFHVYLKQKGSLVTAYGRGRGRAVAVIARWFLSLKIRYLRRELKVDEQAGDTVPWLTVFGSEMREIYRHVDAEMAHAEGIEMVRRRDGRVEVRKQRKTHDLAVLDEESKNRRASVWYLRSCFIQQVHTMRSQLRTKLDAVFGFLIRKIWSLGGEIEAKKKGFFFVLADGEVGADSSSSTQNAYYTDVPENETIVDDTGGRRRVAEVDIYNKNALDAVMGKFKRLSIELHYPVTVSAPVYRKEPRMYRPAGRGTKRTFCNVMGGVGSDGGDAVDSGPYGAYGEGMVGGLPLRRDEDGSTYFLDLPFERLLDEWGGCTVRHLQEHVKERDDAPYVMVVLLSLHLLAAEMLVEYTRVKNIQELMRVSKHTIRAIHSLALALSGLIRHGLGKERMAIEEKARGGAVLGVAKSKHEVSVLLSLMQTAAWTVQDDVKHLHIRYSDYVFREMCKVFEHMQPGQDEISDLNDVSLIADYVDCDVFGTLE